MRTIALLLMALAVLIGLLVLEHRRGTIVSILRLLDFRQPERQQTWSGDGPPMIPNDGPKCLERLARIDGLEFSQLNSFGNDRGCGTRYPVLVKSVSGIDLEGKGLTLSCPIAERFAKWVQKDVKRMARKHGKEPLQQINHMGSYNCRKIAGSSSWSQHSFANAIDIEGVVFEDGEKLTILDDWADEELLQDMAKTACDRFNVVLSPNYNARHKDHLHFDLGPRKTCR